MQSLLSGLTHEFDKHLLDADSGQEVFHATSPHSLIQAAGYLKYIRAKKDQKGVYFRGQTKLYASLQPSLFRGVKDGPSTTHRRGLLDELLENIKRAENALRAVDEDCREALLQHYGIRTTWIDVVDNIWVALWFACHESRYLRKAGEYLHFEKRIPNNNSKVMATLPCMRNSKHFEDCVPNDDLKAKSQYAYILLLESAFVPVSQRPGYYRDEKSETIDLRVAAPSQFVRPHAQHGVLVRRLSKKGLPVSDCEQLHVGTIRVDLSSALDWLGTASTLTAHSLFPPAFYDYGYRELLEFVEPKDALLGRINRVQA